MYIFELLHYIDGNVDTWAWPSRSCALVYHHSGFQAARGAVRLVSVTRGVETSATQLLC